MFTYFTFASRAAEGAAREGRQFFFLKIVCRRLQLTQIMNTLANHSSHCFWEEMVRLDWGGEKKHICVIPFGLLKICNFSAIYEFGEKKNGFTSKPQTYLSLIHPRSSTFLLKFLQECLFSLQNKMLPPHRNLK